MITHKFQITDNVATGGTELLLRYEMQDSSKRHQLQKTLGQLIAFLGQVGWSLPVAYCRCCSTFRRLCDMQTYEATSAEVARAEYAVQLSSRMLQDLQNRLAAPIPSEALLPGPPSAQAVQEAAEPSTKDAGAVITLKHNQASVLSCMAYMKDCPLVALQRCADLQRCVKNLHLPLLMLPSYRMRGYRLCWPKPGQYVAKAALNLPLQSLGFQQQLLSHYMQPGMQHSPRTQLL